ncbi:hypothetical protein BLNAU_20144 [Blattamonas nauphoetae]|uniref:Uncharacterized protein n=1 Tax=Blattamonas nauphoetae TaxID=2049346 RepID=A0ABQ9X076_9EUKA|nr:hypothetical protein BLNAU_20144 [Blattamonas nauphoetae]
MLMNKKQCMTQLSMTCCFHRKNFFNPTFTPSASFRSTRSDLKSPRSRLVRRRRADSEGKVEGIEPTIPTSSFSREMEQRSRTNDTNRDLRPPTNTFDDLPTVFPNQPRTSTTSESHTMLSQPNTSSSSQPTSRLALSRRSRKSTQTRNEERRGGLDPVRRGQTSSVEVSGSVAISVEQMLFDLRSFDPTQQIQGLQTLETLLTTIPIPTICFVAHISTNTLEPSFSRSPSPQHLHSPPLTSQHSMHSPVSVSSSSSHTVPRNITSGCAIILNNLVPLLDDDCDDVQEKAILVLGNTFTILRSGMEDRLKAICDILRCASKQNGQRASQAARDLLHSFVDVEDWIDRRVLQTALESPR